jgi:hypothetical protein
VHGCALHGEKEEVDKRGRERERRRRRRRKVSS